MLYCSPTGHRSPPGVTEGNGEVTLSPVNEYLQRKALITTQQQVYSMFFVPLEPLSLSNK